MEMGFMNGCVLSFCWGLMHGVGFTASKGKLFLERPWESSMTLAFHTVILF